MKYPKEYLDEIKTRLKVSSVISKTVSLKKRGKEFVGLSPFKNEKTPSFTVNDEKGFYHCFSTSEHGNIFDFIMKTQNLKFGESVKYLANLAGMQPYTFSKADEERENDWQNYSEIFKDYIDYHNNDLLKNPDLKEAREYLKSRNLSSTDVKNFSLGFVRNKKNYYQILLKKFKDKDLNESGLFYFDEKKNEYLERFRGRIIFPIKSLTGQFIAAGGRIISKESYLAKYINSPETKFFKKGNNLYNLDKARKFSNSHEEVFLVEGYMDVIGLNKSKIENCVANLGTALTDRQISILNQFFNEIVICFDSDESGFKAAIRAAENSIKELRPEKQISFLFLPEGEDPDSYVNKNGKDKFLNYFNQNKIVIHEFLFNHYKNQSNESPSSLAELEKKLRSITKTIKDQLIQKYVLDNFLGKISSLTPNLSTGKKYAIKHVSSLLSTKKIFNETKSISKAELKEYSILYFIINNLNFFKENNLLDDDLEFITAEGKKIYSDVYNYFNENEDLSFDSLPLEKDLISRIEKFASIKHISNKVKKDPNKLIEIFQEMKKDLKNISLDIKISDLESQFSKDLNENTFNKIKELKKLQNTN
tara:strand:+ start:517 stop:2289 length:1773 start_codon:yes stop_codon:yes gene_type:complete